MQDWVFLDWDLLTYLLGPILVADIHIHQTSMTTTNGNVNEGKKIPIFYLQGYLKILGVW